ncbi:MAG: hypothetical protein JWO83_683 [Caulobacteraceae bacterium]|nr:hypothetical protein [Caulobacteraceae bacterium]
MSELFLLVLDAGVFFIGCTIIFLVGFVIDARSQARRAAAPPAEAVGSSAMVRTTRLGDSEALEQSPAAAA